MVSYPKKALKLPRALKTAAKLPVLVGKGQNRSAQAPKPGEEPIVMLRVQILGCIDVLAKDKGGTSDPFVVATLLRQRHSTPAAKKTLNPTYAAQDATFDFPIYISLAENLGALELVVWDKDLIRKDYLGEVALTLEDWFKNGEGLSFDDEHNFDFEAPIVSTRDKTPAQGSIRLKLGFAPPTALHQFPDYREIYRELVNRTQIAIPTLISAPPTRGIGTIRSSMSGPAYEDDGLPSDDEDVNIAYEDDDGNMLAQSPAPIPDLDLSQLELTPTATPAPLISKQSSGSSFMGFKKGIKRSTFSPRQTSSELSDAGSGTTTPTGTTKKRRPQFKRTFPSEYNFSAQNDILGIVMLEIASAENLPRLKNMTRTGWDMDPFVVVSFGKKVFRTRVIRHSLNPHWDEKLLFHVRQYESQFNVQFSVLDWDKLTSNDHIGDVTINVAEFLKNAPKPDEKTGLYPATADGSHDMQEFKFPLNTNGDGEPSALANALSSPSNIIFKAKYQPYDALRQHFWRQYLKQYDSDDTGKMSLLEITSMLDSLGSTLSHETVKSFFERNDKASTDELTIDEAIICLEREISRPRSERKTVSQEPEGPISDSGFATPLLDSSLPPTLGLDFSGPGRLMDYQQGPLTSPIRETSKKPSLPPTFPTEPSQQPVQDLLTIPGTAADSSPRSRAGRLPTPHREDSLESSDADDHSSGSGQTAEDSVERVINVKTCPLCHHPRLSSKAEVDMVTHIAVCASQDWNRVDRIVVGNFVTPSQAQRKWFMKVISKVSSGAYRVGANSANIIVQNRMTGQLEEEKMQVYIRLGIRLLYKGAKGRMEGARARRLLKSLSVKQGRKFDNPISAAEIPAFIEFHKLNKAEIRDPISSFKTFNEFFYRKLKEDARPVTNPDDPGTLVSGADCRMMTFESVSEATKLWIKGREFSVARLLGEAYKEQAQRYIGGALCIFRLAPQDYHRFHSPVDGVIGPMSFITGEYYTVNPQAIRTGLDVYGENVRKIVPIDSPTFGRVMAVCIGAMMVGSILTTVTEGEPVARGEEFGYFAFGGSTIVCLFEKDAVEFDEDLIINGRACLETLVRVGMGIGKSTRPART